MGEHDIVKAGDYGSLSKPDWCQVPLSIDTAAAALSLGTQALTGFKPPQVSTSWFCPPPGEDANRESSLAYYERLTQHAAIQATWHLGSQSIGLFRGEADMASLGEIVNVGGKLFVQDDGIPLASKAILFHLGSVAAPFTYDIGDRIMAKRLGDIRIDNAALTRRTIAFSLAASNAAAAEMHGGIRKIGEMRRAKKEYAEVIDSATQQFIEDYGTLPDTVSEAAIENAITVLLTGEGDANSRMATIRALAEAQGLDYKNPDDVSSIEALFTAAAIESATKLQSANQLVALMKLVTTLKIHSSVKTIMLSSFAGQIAVLNANDGRLSWGNWALALSSPAVNFASNWATSRGLEMTPSEWVLSSGIDLGSNVYALGNAALFYDNPDAAQAGMEVGFTVTSAATTPFTQAILSRVTPYGYLPDKPIFGLPTGMARGAIIVGTGLANARRMSQASRLAVEGGQNWPWQFKNAGLDSVPRYIGLGSIDVEAAVTGYVASDGNNAKEMASYYLWNQTAFEDDLVTADEFITNPPNIYAGQDWRAFASSTAFKLGGTAAGVGLEAWEKHLETKGKQDSLIYKIVSNDERGKGFAWLDLPEPLEDAVAEYVIKPIHLTVAPTFGEGLVDLNIEYKFNF